MPLPNTGEKLHDYDLVQYSGYSPPRASTIYRLTEAEAHTKNQAFALNGIGRRFVRIKPYKPYNSIDN